MVIARVAVRVTATSRTTGVRTGRGAVRRTAKGRTLEPISARSVPGQFVNNGAETVRIVDFVQAAPGRAVHATKAARRPRIRAGTKDGPRTKR